MRFEHKQVKRSASQIARAINNGATWLDATKKNWAKEIDAERLDLGHFETCPLTLLGFADWDLEFDTKQNLVLGWSFENEPEATIEYANKCWRQELTQRKHSVRKAS